MSDDPTISIAIPTLNSERTLEKTLKSIQRQNYPKNKIEVLVIDGGSKDNTLDIAKKYGCEIIPNPKVQLIFGKHIGYMRAKGQYLLSLDSDEVLANPNSLRLRISTFRQNDQVRVVMSSGLETPKDYSPINYYINNFGDPFSYFVYGLSHNPKFYVKQLSCMAAKVYEDQNCAILKFPSKANLPIIEPTGAGGIIDLHYTRQSFPNLKSDPELTTHVFYLLNNIGGLLGVTKNDPVVHYSAASLKTYLGKISSKVKNNIFQTTMGKGGFIGRERYALQGYKKYLFIPYSFSLLFPFIDSLYFVITRKKLIFLIHPFLCLYTSLVIIYFYFCKLLGNRPKFIGYGS